MKALVSMKDIAFTLGVSVVTVSKALSGKEGVGEELRAKIIDEATRQGYRKNANASDMRKGTSHDIGIIVREHSLAEHRVSTTLIQGIIKNLTSLGYYAIEEIITKEQERKGILPKIAQENKVEGIIFAGFLKPSYVMKIQKTGIPTLLVDFSSPTSNDDSIICDNVYGSYLLTRHLISLGHEHIVFVGNPLFDDNNMDRYLGYIKALKEQGLTEYPSINDVNDLGDSILIEINSKASAYVCASSKTAFGLEKQLQSLGKRIPEDVSIVTFNDDVYSQIASPPLTAFHVDYNEMAYLSAITMVGKVSEKTHVGRKTISGKLVVRESSSRDCQNVIYNISRIG